MSARHQLLALNRQAPGWTALPKDFSTFARLTSERGCNVSAYTIIEKAKNTASGRRERIDALYRTKEARRPDFHCTRRPPLLYQNASIPHLPLPVQIPSLV